MTYIKRNFHILLSEAATVFNKNTTAPQEIPEFNMTEEDIAEFKRQLANLNYYSNIANYLTLIGAFVGFVGSLWIITQFHKKRILNNTPGLFITVIAYLDLGCCWYYFQKGISDGFRLYDTNWQRAWDIVFDWSAVSYCLMGMLLSFNTLYIIRFHGCATSIDRYKWIAIGTCLIFPILVLFLPVALVKKLNMFDVRPDCFGSIDDPCNDIKAMIATILMSVICASVFCSLVAYLGVWWVLYRHENSPTAKVSKAVFMLKRLIMVYSLAIVVMWLPYLIRFALVNIVSKSQTSTDLEFFTEFSYVTFFIFCRDLFTPMRGYFHALAVIYVYKTVNVDKSSWKNVIAQIFLIAPLARKKQLQTNHSTAAIESGAVDSAGPHWTQDERFSICHTPVEAQASPFTFSQFSTQVRNSSYLAPHQHSLRQDKKDSLLLMLDDYSQ